MGFLNHPIMQQLAGHQSAPMQARLAYAQHAAGAHNPMLSGLSSMGQGAGAPPPMPGAPQMPAGGMLGGAAGQPGQFGQSSDISNHPIIQALMGNPQQIGAPNPWMAGGVPAGPAPGAPAGQPNPKQRQGFCGHG